MNTDTERLDWLERCVKEEGKVVTAENVWDSLEGAYTGIVNMFTVPAQHIQAPTLREAIDISMNKS